MHFGGRLGTYKYLDMHQAVAAALKAFETVFQPMFESGRGLASANERSTSGDQTERAWAMAGLSVRIRKDREWSMNW